MKKKHIVFILGNYYPYFSANGLCAKNIIEVLKLEYKVTVVCEKSGKEQMDIENYNFQTLMRIETEEIKRRIKHTHLFQSKRKSFATAISTLIQVNDKIKRYVRAVTFKENINNFTVNEYVKVLRSIEDPIDLIIPICFPFESILAALSYKQYYNNSVKVVPYLFDKFSASSTLHRTKWNQKLKFNRHLLLEKKMMDECDYIAATEDWENHIKMYFNDYIKKIKYLEIPALTKIEKTSLSLFNDKRVHFVYTGSLNYKMRSPQYTLELFSTCMIDRDDIVLDLYIAGNCGNLVDKFAKENPQQIINHGKVPINIAHTAMNSADFLVSIGNSDISQKPSKIYEYMSTGKPIIHLFHSKHDPVINILKKYPMSCCIEQDKLRNEQNMVLLMDFISDYSKVLPITFSEVEKNFIRATPAYVAQEFISIIGD